MIQEDGWRLLSLDMFQFWESNTWNIEKRTTTNLFWFIWVSFPDAVSFLVLFGCWLNIIIPYLVSFEFPFPFKSSHPAASLPPVPRFTAADPRQCGRSDVGLRCLSAALFRSQGVRHNTQAGKKWTGVRWNGVGLGWDQRRGHAERLKKEESYFSHYVTAIARKTRIKNLWICVCYCQPGQCHLCGSRAKMHVRNLVSEFPF